MNIVFLLRLWPIYGGGETVTICLANEMAKRGHAVTVFYFKDSETNELPYIDPSIKAVRIPDVRCDEYTYDSDDGIKITIALKLYQQNSFDFIINQWWPVVFLSPLRSFFNAKIISVHHTALYTRSVIEGFCLKSILKRVFFLLYRFFEKERQLSVIDKLLIFSDKVLFLSPQFKDQYIQLRNPKSVEKLDWCYNPLVFDNFISMDEICKKRKEVLFVGRIFEYHKRLSYILKIWSKIEKDHDFDEWTLKIVGDGPDMSLIKELSNRLQIRRITFEGFKNPRKYYNEASIFVMTSAFEGFGMTLVEAQQYATVPIVMDTYLSLHDIIINENNGVIIPDNDINMYVSKLKQLMSDDKYRLKLAYNGLSACKKFNVKNITDKWELLLNNLIK